MIEGTNKIQGENREIRPALLCPVSLLRGHKEAGEGPSSQGAGSSDRRRDGLSPDKGLYRGDAGGPGIFSQRPEIGPWTAQESPRALSRPSGGW